MGLNEKFIIVRLHQSKWSSWAYDKETAAKTAIEAGANPKDVHNTKRRIAKQAIQEIINNMGKAYGYHIAHTLPTGEKGDRLLPISLLDEYKKTIDDYIKKIDEAVEKFIPEYPNWIEEARQRLGKLFKPSDYPPANELREKFKMSYGFMPLPSMTANSWGLPKMVEKSIRDSVIEELEMMRNAAMADLWDRIYKNVSHLVERLSNADKIFRNTLTKNIVDLCNVLEKLNPNGDTKLEEMRIKLLEKFGNLDPEHLRNNRKMRVETHKIAEEILKEVEIERRKITV